MNVQLKRFGLFLFPCLLLADTFGPGFSGYSTVPVFVNNINSPGNPLVPVSYGGLTLNPSNPGQLIIGGNAEGSGAAFYSIAVTRSFDGHIGGLTGVPAPYLSAPKLSAGASFGPSFNPGEVFFFSIFSGSGGVDVGMARWGSAAPAKTVNIVPETPGGLGFVPIGFGGAGELKILTYSGKFYAVTMRPDPEGTYDLTGAQLKAVLPAGGTQGFVYIKGGSPGFTVDSLLVAEYTTGAIAAYNVDATGNPLPGTRRVFLSGPPIARPSGLFVDPQSGDVLVSTLSGSTSGIYRIQGFLLPASIPVSSCQSITAPGYYHLTSDLSQAGAGYCIDIHNTSDVHLNCVNHSVTAPGDIQVSNVHDFSIRNCRLLYPPSFGLGMTITGSSRGLIAANVVGDSAIPKLSTTIDHATNLNVVSNTTYGSIHSDSSSYVTIRFNQVSSTDRSGLITVSVRSCF